MQNKDEIEKILSEVLPSTSASNISILAEVLQQFMAGKTNSNAISSEVVQAIHDLSGQDIITQDTLLSFGDAQTGDVTINDIAGGNIVRLTINLTTKDQKESVLSLDGAQVGEIEIGTVSGRDTITNYNSYGVSEKDIHLKYLRVAGNFLKAQDLKGAIRFFSKSIDIEPTHEAFLGRSRAILSIHYKLEGKERVAAKHRAIQDASNAVEFADTFDAQKQSRLFRLNLAVELMAESFLLEDIKWLKPHVTGRDKADVLVGEVDFIASNDVYFQEKDNAEIVSVLLTEATELGRYDIIMSYHWMNLHIGAKNFGLALKEIDKALKLQEKESRLRSIRNAQIGILIQISELPKAFEMARKLQLQFPDMKDGFLGGISDIQEQLLYYCALAFEFEPLLVNDKMAIKTIVNIILKINPSIMDKYKLLSSTLRSIQNYAISQ